MLTTLHIQNFALIDNVVLEFKKGYTTLTGETGSGKSILLGALNLILGERADFSVIGPSSDKAVVEAEFELANFHLEAFFQSNDIDSFNPTIIRREINNQGRSRAFINDSPVQLGVLKELTEKLVHIHSQHNTLELRKPDFQIELLDTLSGLDSLRQEYTLKFKFWNTERKNLIQLKDKLALSLQQSDYNRFQLEELEELHLEKYNYQDLEVELTRNENVDGLKSTLDAIVSAIENEEGASGTLRKLKSLLERSKGVDVVLDELSNRIQSTLIELQDISGDAENYLEKIEIDPHRLSELTLLLDQYNRVLRKHNLLNQDQLVVLKNNLSADLDDTGELQSLIEIKTEEVKLLKNSIDKLAEELHSKRVLSAKQSEDAIKLLLKDLKMPDTQFLFDFVKRDELNNHGCTDVKMLFSPNKGMQPISIEKAASGGELSRLMLALQNLVSSKKQLPTIIFDEIDTGVSGEVAQKIGALLKKMGSNLQLLAITHLPQVAGKADYHFKVEKYLTDNRTQTNVRVLNQDERIEEIARLMSGEEINEAALMNAKALMN